MQLFLKHVNEGRRLKEIIKNRILLLHTYDSNDELIETLLVYGLTTMEENDKIEIAKFLNEEFGKKEGERIMASVAQKWYDEGIEKGMQAGVEKTAINMLNLLCYHIVTLSCSTHNVREVCKTNYIMLSVV